MAENKTQPTNVAAEEFLAAVEHPGRRADGFELLEMMRGITGQEAVMWGPTIVGFGSYHYKYDSGGRATQPPSDSRRGRRTWCCTGSSRGPTQTAASRLGKYKPSTACLYVNKLDDVDRDILAEMIRSGYRHVTTELHNP